MDEPDPRSVEQFYVGEELHLFAEARVWKDYVARQIATCFGPRVLEVGAGMGATTAALAGVADAAGTRRWTCLEPDPHLRAEVARGVRSGELPAWCDVAGGTLGSLAPSERYDTILYLDVLEHIEDDRGEVQAAYDRLTPGGRLVILAPAHDALFTPFDEAIGHFRRYDRRRCLDLEPAGARRLRLRYLDCVGLLASLGNRLVLSSAMPTPRQLWFWDRILVRASKLLDPLTAYRLGKSILVVWQRP